MKDLQVVEPSKKTKRCGDCDEVKSTSEFPRDRTKKDGLRRSCKLCSNKKSAVYRKKNAEKLSAAASVYRSKNIEKIRERDAKYRRDHRADIIEGNARYRKSTKAERAEYAVRYRRENPGKSSAHDAVRKAIAKGVMKRPDVCNKCDSSGCIEGHHPDYSRPLLVIWLCKSCHRFLHASEEKESR